MTVSYYSRHSQALVEMKIGAREPDGTCESCYKWSAWAGKWPKPDLISILSSWMGQWIIPVVFLTLVYDPGWPGFLESLAIPVLQTKPIKEIKEIRSSAGISGSLLRAVLKINWTDGGMVNLLDFEYCVTGLAFALASRPTVRHSRSKYWSSLSCPQLWLTRAPSLTLEGDRIKDLKFDLCPLVC